MNELIKQTEEKMNKTIAVLERDYKSVRAGRANAAVLDKISVDYYLNTKNAGAFLPEALSAMLTGTLDGFAGRINSLLFKQGVDINLMGQIIAYDTELDDGEYERLRGKAIRDMKRTNGRISFKDALDFQKSV